MKPSQYISRNLIPTLTRAATPALDDIVVATAEADKLAGLGTSADVDAGTSRCDNLLVVVALRLCGNSMVLPSIEGRILTVPVSNFFLISLTLTFAVRLATACFVNYKNISELRILMNAIRIYLFKFRVVLLNNGGG
jgi:hypothetical protein